jgi:hypothetical protein
MVKGLEKKFNRIVENSDPKELEDKIVEYSIEAIDDVMLNGNKNDGLEKMRTTVKFFEDHTSDHPKNFANATYKIMSHLLITISENYRDVVSSNHELKLFINLMGIIDLMSFNYITELISLYQEENDELYLKYAKDRINELKKMKIEMLDNEIFPEALKELKNRSQDYRGYDEEIHKEFVNGVKNDIRSSKSDKKNIGKKGL